MNLDWQKAADILNSGGVVIIPSDSSFGLAAVAKNPDAINKLYNLKGREKNKPSLLIVSSKEQLEELVEVTPLALDLIQKYWPGGLTLVLTAKDHSLPEEIYGVDKTLAIRLPNKKELTWLAEKVGPFILPSANISGESAPFKKVDLDSNLVEKVDFVINEETDANPVSTLVDVRGQLPIILRPGSVVINK